MTSTRAQLLLTLTQPMSHCDPAVQDKSNRKTFNRQGVLMARSAAIERVPQPEIDAVAAAHPVPGDIAPDLQTLTYPEFVAVALVRMFIDAYNGHNDGDGAGLFSGTKRYERLTARVGQAAIATTTLRAWRARLTGTMLVPVHGGDDDRDLYGLLSLSPATQAAVRAVLLESAADVVGIARMWHTAVKQQSAAYAKKAGTEQSAPSVPLKWDAADIPAMGAGAMMIELPTFQGNSARHQIVREPGMLHLMKHLGIDFAFPGAGCLPEGVEAIFANGGAIAGGVSEPSGSHGLAWQMRETFPLLDLLGGCANAFTLGTSRLAISARLVCAENAPAFTGTPAADLPNATLSAFEMLDEVTHTHMASRHGIGQMIQGGEVLAEGSQFVATMTLAPFTPDLTKGALMAAVETYLMNNPHIGGLRRVDFGAVRGEWLTPIENGMGLQVEYEAYLSENQEVLREGLMAGTMGTGAGVLA